MKPNTRASGFASMESQKQREIARKGGMAAHQKGTAHEFTPEEARTAGRKGGQQVSANRAHMIAIGRLGGQRSAARRRQKSNERGSVESEQPAMAQQEGKTEAPEAQPGNHSGEEHGFQPGNEDVNPSQN